MSEEKRQRGSDIAIIGMAGRFPGAPSIEAFWQNVRDGVESIRPLSDEELLAAKVPLSVLHAPNYVKACPVLDDIDKFDASFFGFSPRDASVMDPAHRLFLELAYAALEHAGYTGLPAESTVSVFAGAGAPLYMMENLRTNAELMQSMGDFLVRHTGNDMNFLATRVSYELDLRGPSMNVQTACSSALVSVHMACHSLLRGECTLALAGGATVLVPMGQGYHYQEGEILSPDGHCRPFDAKSAGTVFGSGAGCVVLKRLDDALDDGDTIHAVIKGSAINNDGSLKVGYLAPSVDGQAEVVEAALKAARIDAASVSYVETHGTGTLVGDPIEFEALRQAFSKQTNARQFCALGSVKSNIGHLGEAAGIASLIKAVLALQHRQLPPSLGYESPNPQIDFASSPFFVNAQLRPWLTSGTRRCGVTALGAGGTNCHLILEEAPDAVAGEGARPQQLLMLSAQTRSALERASDNLAARLADGAIELADVAYTLALGRRTMPHRRVVVASTAQEAAARLEERDPKFVQAMDSEGRTPSVVFLFPGGGAQYAGMGAELYDSEEVYRSAIDECLTLAARELNVDLSALLFAPLAEREQATRTLERPSLTLPALFATEYALAKLLRAWGVEPVALVGHSMGEYVAACLAGVFTLEEALRLVLLRGRLFEQVPAGGMLSVPLSESEASAAMPAELSIAAVNAPELCVVSGPLEAIESFEQTLAARGVETTRVRINVAAHSSMLDPILPAFRALCQSIRFQAPRLPLVSNLTGTWITRSEATDPEYWVRHLRGTVRFGDCVETVLKHGDRALLEVGPGRTLSTLAKAQHTAVRSSFNSMRHPQEPASDLGYALQTLGRLWLCGVSVDFHAFYDGQLRNRVPLPTYPFERTSFWIEPGRTKGGRAHHESGKRARLDDWFSVPSFRKQPLLHGSRSEPGTRTTSTETRWLLFSDGSPLAKMLIARLGPGVVVVTPGVAVMRRSELHWELDMSSSNQHQDLLDALDEHGQRPSHVVYLAADSLAERVRSLLRPQDERLTRGLDEGFFIPTFIARALGRLGEPMQLSIVTSGVVSLGDEPLEPLRALTLGPVLVAPREFPQLQTRCIDVSRPLVPALSGDVDDALLHELREAPDQRVVALRPSGRWLQTFAQLELPAPSIEASWLRTGGVYVITGGLGGIALELALHMAKRKNIKLALLARSELPPEYEWDAILANVHAASRGAQRIRTVRELRELGSEVRVITCDIVDAESLARALSEVRRELGAIRGVIHAAGVMDDEPMEGRTLVSMQRVLEPKVQGTLLLDELVHEPLDVFVLFSSVAACLGLPGQVDYTAANAFLDAFAHQRARRAAGRTVVINWNAWREIGMAAVSHEVRQHGRLPSSPCAHPALDGYSDDRADGRTFMTDFSAERHWLVAEHRIRGSAALLSGTTFVELARAAFAVGRKPGPIEMADLSFLSPFQIADGQTRRLSIRLTPAGDASELTMQTAGADPRTAPHVVGDIREYRGALPPRLDIEALCARCSERQVSPPGGFLEQSFVDFGPRWANISRIRHGQGEALVELSLDERFAGNLEHYHLHPALLDMATGGVQSLIPGFDARYDFYVPVRYGRLRVFAPLQTRLFSHVQCRKETGRGSAYFDVLITDADGHPCVEVVRFEMRRLEAGSAMLASQAALPPTRRADDSALAGILREAIAPAEGVQAFERIMAQPSLVQCIASSVDVELWAQQLAARNEPARLNDDEGGGTITFSRPNLTSEYELPGSPSELLLAQVWSQLLGVRQVGVHDDFFELGGNSLLAVRLFAAIKKNYGVSLPLSTLFEAPSIRLLAELLDANAPKHDVAVGVSEAPVGEPPRATYSSLVPMQLHGDRPPFYCAAGMGGNPLNLRALALLVGMDQPFYGLQPQGLDGSSPLHASVPQMASYYLEQIRVNQPRGPYYLGGYSGGGVVAFEMAKQLVRAGERVGALVFLDSLAPVMPLRTRRERMEMHLERLRRRGVSYALDAALAKVESQLRSVAVAARRPVAKLFPYQFRLENIEDTWREAASAYRPGPYAGDAMLFRASDSSALVSGTAIRFDERNGWMPYVLGGVEVSACPGDHSSLCEQPNVRVLARRLRAYLDERMAMRESEYETVATQAAVVVELHHEHSGEQVSMPSSFVARSF